MSKAQRQNGMATNFGILYGKKESNVSDERKYNITVTETQAELLVCALDLYSRIGIGQFEEVASVYDPARKLENWDSIHTLLLAAKEEAGHPRNGSHGIMNPKVRDVFRAAYDLQQVIRHKVAWSRNPEGSILVHHDTPHQTSEKVPLATITEVK